MLPYWFSAMTMKSVGSAALKIVEEVRRQFNSIPGIIMEGGAKPDYANCVKISTDASIREMIPPDALVMLTPLIVGAFFVVETLAGVLAGSLVSGVQVKFHCFCSDDLTHSTPFPSLYLQETLVNTLSHHHFCMMFIVVFHFLGCNISLNTRGAWDNDKKYIEDGASKHAKTLGPKGLEAHKAAVIGDTIGNPLKDNSAPSLNILIKLMAIESLVFAPFFATHGGFAIQMALKKTIPTNQSR